MIVAHPSNENIDAARTFGNVERHLLTGCYELLHFGHLNALRQVKQSATDPTTKIHVVAGIHSNEEILRVKGGVCILTEEEKERTLLACKFVDEVVHNVPYDTIYPENASCVYCWHGDDAVTGASGNDIFGYAKDRKMFKELRRTEGISTTLMIGRFFDSAKLRDTTGYPSEVSSSSMSEIAKQVLSSKDKKDVQFANATASRISRFFLPARGRHTAKRVVYLEGYFDLFHVGYVDLLNFIIQKELERCGLTTDKDGSEDDARSPSDVFVILGILHGDECLQSLHERGISMLSLKKVDDVVLDVRNRPDAEFRRALGIHSVYAVENHVDFISGRMRSALVEGDCASELEQRLSYPCVVDYVIDGSTFFSGKQIVERVLQSRKILEARQRQKVEPAVALTDDLSKIDGV